MVQPLPTWPKHATSIVETYPSGWNLTSIHASYTVIQPTHHSHSPIHPLTIDCNFHCWNTWNSTRLWIIGLFWYVCISCDIQHNQQRHIGSSLMIVESVQPQYLWHQEQNVLPDPHLSIHHVTASKCHCIFHSKTQSRSRYICLSISSPCGNT